MVSSEVVVKKINESFQSLEYPGDLNIVYDNTGNHLECMEVQEAFRGKHWSEVNHEVLLRQKAGLFFMTPAAFRFYFPAYLLFVVQAFDQSDALPETTVQCLTLPVEADDLAKANFFLESSHSIQTDMTQFLLKEIERSNEKVHRFLERVSGFDREQCQAIRFYLEHLKDHHQDYFFFNELQIAVERYWFIYTYGLDVVENLPQVDAC